jgi:hypothetical protein
VDVAEYGRLPWRMANCRLVVGLRIAKSVETGGRALGKFFLGWLLRFAADGYGR